MRIAWTCVSESFVADGLTLLGKQELGIEHFGDGRNFA
jgi:hypothetical protein